mgnify:FL=1
MNIKKFIISSSARWFDLFTTAIFSIIAVPIMLSKWSVETYAAWILLMGITTYVNMPTKGLNTYIFSKNLQLGKTKKKEISKNITSSLPITIFITLVTIFFLTIEFKYELITNNLNIAETIKKEFILALLLFAVSSLITFSISPFYTQALSIFGYLPLFTWSGSVRIFIGYLLLISGIYFYNTSFLISFIILTTSNIFFHLGEYIIIFFVLKKEKIKYEPINIKQGVNDFLKSIWISLTNITETIGTHGMRIIISTLASPMTLVMFATIRTITNMFMQLLDTIRSPLLIVIMESISEKDKKKININFKLYYLFISIIVYPLLIIFHFFVEDVYKIWTLGNIKFNLETYSILVVAVLVACINFPYRIIISGNNLIKRQFLIISIKSLFLIIFIYSFYEDFKILSFSIAILLSELIELLFNYLVIESFFKKIKFSYDKHLLLGVLINLIISSSIFVIYLLNDIYINDSMFFIMICVLLYLLNIILMLKNSKILIKRVMQNN